MSPGRSSYRSVRTASGRALARSNETWVTYESCCSPNSVPRPGRCGCGARPGLARPTPRSDCARGAADFPPEGADSERAPGGTAPSDASGSGYGYGYGGPYAGGGTYLGERSGNT